MHGWLFVYENIRIMNNNADLEYPRLLQILFVAMGFGNIAWDNIKRNIAVYGHFEK